MLVGFTSEQDETGKKINFYYDFDEGLRKYFENKSYGEGLNIFVICFLCVDFIKSKIHLEAGFFKEREPRYKKKQKSLTMDIRLNGNMLVENNLSENINLLESKVLEYMNKIDKYKKVIPSFDVEKFKKDFVDVFKKEMKKVRNKYKFNNS